jgi:hypothetical protein
MIWPSSARVSAIPRAAKLSTIMRGLCGFSAIGAHHAPPYEALARGKRWGRAAEAQKAPYALGKALSQWLAPEGNQRRASGQFWPFASGYQLMGWFRRFVAARGAQDRQALEIRP